MNNQIKLVKSSGFLTEYAEQMRKDILSKGVTKKGNKLIVNPKYKNVLFDVYDYFEEQIKNIRLKGIKHNNIIKYLKFYIKILKVK